MNKNEKLFLDILSGEPHEDFDNLIAIIQYRQYGEQQIYDNDYFFSHVLPRESELFSYEET